MLIRALTPHSNVVSLIGYCVDPLCVVTGIDLADLNVARIS